MKLITTLQLLIVIGFTSCATIISGSRQTVQISSQPNAAVVYLNEIEVGKTPIVENLKRNQNYQLVLKLDGYKPYEIMLEKKFNAWYIGNVLIGGIVGLVIDPITGALFKLKPEEINGKIKNGTALKTINGNIFITISMDVDPNWEKLGQLNP